jgi:hypothetical protein
MSVTSVSTDIDQSVSKVPLLHSYHTKTLDAGCNGRTVSCGAVGDVSLEASSDSGLVVVIKVSIKRFLTSFRSSNSTVFTQFMEW